MKAVRFGVLFAALAPLALTACSGSDGDPSVDETTSSTTTSSTADPATTVAPHVGEGATAGPQTVEKFRVTGADGDVFDVTVTNSAALLTVKDPATGPAGTATLRSTVTGAMEVTATAADGTPVDLDVTADSLQALPGYTTPEGGDPSVGEDQCGVVLAADEGSQLMWMCHYRISGGKVTFGSTGKAESTSPEMDAASADAVVAAVGPAPVSLRTMIVSLQLTSDEEICPLQLSTGQLPESLDPSGCKVGPPG